MIDPFVLGGIVGAFILIALLCAIDPDYAEIETPWDDQIRG